MALSPVIAAWEINRSVTFVSRMSAGTRSPAENRIRLPTTNSSPGISRSSPFRLTVAQGQMYQDPGRFLAAYSKRIF